MARFSNDVASPHFNGIRLQNNPVDLDAIAQANNYASFGAWQEADPIGASLAERQNGAQGSYQQAALHDDPDWLKQGLIIGGTVGGGALADWAMGGGLAGAGGAGATGGGGASAGGAGAGAGTAGTLAGVDTAVPTLAAGSVGLPAGVGTAGTLAGAPIAGGIVSTAPFAGAGGAMATGAATPGIVSTTPIASGAFGAGAGGAGAGGAAGAAGAGGAAAATPTLGMTGTTGLPAGVGNVGKLAGPPVARSGLGAVKTAGDILESVGAGVGGATKAAAANRGAENRFNVDVGNLDVDAYNANASAQEKFQNDLIARSKLEATARGTEAGNIYRASVLHNPTAGPQNPRPQVFSPGLIKTYDDLAEQGSTDLAERPVYDPRTMTAPTYTPYNRPLPVFKQPGTLEQAGNWVGPVLSTVGSALAKRYL